MKKIYLLSLVLFSFITNAQDLSKTYDISVDGVNVGTLTASKQIDGDKTTYTIDSKSTVHFLGKTTITTSFISVFRNGVLESSTYTSEKDGHPYDSSVIVESNDIYTIRRKGKNSTLNMPIKYVTCMLYFEEPNVSEQYFDVLDANYNPIENTSSGTYVYTDSVNNEKTTYTYSDDTLEQGTTKHSFYSFTFKLKK